MSKVESHKHIKLQGTQAIHLLLRDMDWQKESQEDDEADVATYGHSEHST